VIANEIGGVAFDAVAGADFHDTPVGTADQREGVEENAVLAVLRVATELDVGEIRQISSPPGNFLY
jgi:hypothetical protein